MTEDFPTLEKMSLAHLLVWWRPGSADRSWAEEYKDVMTHPHTSTVRERVLSEGFGFQDYVAPVLLGPDGRVWDGHHRICLAIEQEVPYLMVER